MLESYIFPSKLTNFVNARAMLAHRLRRWSSIATVLVLYRVFAGYRMLLIGRDGRLDQSEAYDIS